LDEVDKADDEVVTLLASLFTSREVHGHKLEGHIRMMCLANEFSLPPKEFMINRMIWIPFPEPGREAEDVFADFPDIRWLVEGLVTSRPCKIPERVVSKRTAAVLSRWIAAHPEIVFGPHAEVLLRGLVPDEAADKMIERIRSNNTLLWEYALQNLSPEEFVEELPRLLFLKEGNVRSKFIGKLYDRMKSDHTREVTLAVLAVCLGGEELISLVNAKTWDEEKYRKLVAESRERYQRLRALEWNFVFE
jgi:hypothetical protein